MIGLPNMRIAGAFVAATMIAVPASSVASIETVVPSPQSAMVQFVPYESATKSLHVIQLDVKPHLSPRDAALSLFGKMQEADELDHAMVRTAWKKVAVRLAGNVLDTL